MNVLLARLPLLAHADVNGRVVGVIGGDTISVLVDGQARRVRLAEVGAPKKGQAFGRRSKQSLSDLILGKEVELQQVSTDQYGRMAAHVCIGGIDASLEQVRRGMAWSYDQSAKDPAIRKASAAAKLARVGLWQDARPVVSSVYRKSGGGAGHRRPAPVAVAPITAHAGEPQSAQITRRSDVPLPQLENSSRIVPSASIRSSGGHSGTGSVSGGHDLHIGPRGGTHYESSSGSMQDLREGPFAAANLRAIFDQLNIPDWVRFADLNIELEWGTSRLLFAPAPLVDVCRATGMVPAEILGNADLSCSLICAWYRAHRDAGGDRNPIVEQVIKEVAARQDGSGR